MCREPLNQNIIQNVAELSFYDTPTPFYTYRNLIITFLTFLQKKSYKEILAELKNKSVKYSYYSLAKYTFIRLNLMKIF